MSAPSATDSGESTTTRVASGVSGLDAILGGGLPPGHLYLLEGTPGTGKTTLALQFLLAGAQRGQRGVYVTLSETSHELTEVAASHGWTLDGIEVIELSADEGGASDEFYTVFHPAELELQQTMSAVLEAIERSQPALVVLDSLSEMRLLARDPLRFRRQILALKHFFVGRHATVLLLDDKSGGEGDLQLHSLAHGVVVLEHVALEYGAERRRLQVTKLRGLRFWGGYHDFRIRTGGVVVYPRVATGTPVTDTRPRLVESGSPPLDRLLGGGLQVGSSLLIIGAAGTGKSVLSTQYACAATARGENVRFYLFDERLNSFLLRNQGLGMDLDAALSDGRLKLQQIEPTQMSPGEFANEVARAVECDDVKMIIIDSINGYMKSMPEERLLAIQVHELLSYLSNRGVTSIMTLVQQGIFGNPVDEAAEISYLADNVLLLRYFEVLGSVRQALSVVKKRSGNHERTIRECRVAHGGLSVGEPLVEFQGVLTGVPQYIGAVEPLMHNESDRQNRARLPVDASS
jgi:circadian clock protein KaiC